jgi:hypothetical protein
MRPGALPVFSGGIDAHPNWLVSLSLCNGKGWIEQLADLLYCQIFKFNGIAPSASEIDTMVSSLGQALPTDE